MNLEEELTELWDKRSELIRKSPKTPADIVEKERLGNLLDKSFRQHEKPLIEDMLETGIRIKSVWDFVNTPDKYPEAIPVLIKHLNRSYHHRIKEGIVRALAVKEAKGLANKTVMHEYLKLPKESPEEPWIFHYRWAFGNTMRIIVTNDDLSELIEVVLDGTNGDSRDMFVRALAKLKSPKVRETLEKLVKDKSPTVAEEARKALSRKRPAN